MVIIIISHVDRDDSCKKSWKWRKFSKDFNETLKLSDSKKRIGVLIYKSRFVIMGLMVVMNNFLLIQLIVDTATTTRLSKMMMMNERKI